MGRLRSREEKRFAQACQCRAKCETHAPCLLVQMFLQSGFWGDDSIARARACLRAKGEPVGPRESPDGAGEVARAQGQEGKQKFIFSCWECASAPYLDIRRQGELEAAGPVGGDCTLPLPGSSYNGSSQSAPLSSSLGALGLL